MPLHHKGTKHSKKRNTGLIYEFLLRYIVDSILRNDRRHADIAMSIIKRYYRPGTEIYREWRLMNAVVKTQGVDETMANAIIRETRDAVRRYDRVRLDREKSCLIREINHALGKRVYDMGVKDYKLYATVQTLFNDWRNTGVPNISRIADYERIVQQHLLEAPKRDVNTSLNIGPGEGALIVKLMAEKLNKRYGNKFDEVQRSILSMYAYDGLSSKLIKLMHDVKERTQHALDEYERELKNSDDENANTYTLQKLAEVKNIVASLDPNASRNDESVVARVLKLCELYRELTTKGE